MDNKRPLGVTIFGCLAIFAGARGIMGMFGPKCPLPSAGACNFGAFSYIAAIVMSLCALAGGFYLLKMKPWARKLIIALAAINIVITVAQYRPKEAKALYDRQFTMQEEMIVEQYKPEYQQESLAKLRKAKSASDKIFPFAMFLAIFFTVGFNALVIYYFNRPKTKEAFEHKEKKPMDTAEPPPVS
ncbi:MAG: hypothetical protein JW788_04070 [Candidatus Omnitrophica bacterium]|nr:hypothetical protein [Candidatus Omnitrophota bacterium]